MSAAPQTELAPASRMKYWAFIRYSSHDARRWALPLRKQAGGVPHPEVRGR
jgi:hypothetical protein